MARQVKLNQEHEYFICPNKDDGSIIFHIDPLVPVVRISGEKIGSVRIVEMLRRTPMTAFVGGGPKPKYNDRVVVVYNHEVWDEQYHVRLNEPVLDVKLTMERLVVISRSMVFIVVLQTGKICAQLKTRDNPLGVCAMSQNRLVFPAEKDKGYIRIEDLYKDDSSTESKPPLIVKAHGNEIVCAAQSYDGKLIATASSQGTNIHVYNIEEKKTCKFRRGVDRANIFCLNFSKDNKYLCCSSDKGTVHIWTIQELMELNPVSVIKPLVGLPPEIKSYAQFEVTAESPCVCAFGNGDVIYAICLDGSFHKYKLGRDGSQTETGRNCYRVSYAKYPIIAAIYD